jgi:hypothetical protein
MVQAGPDKKQDLLYRLSHTSSPFSSGYFGERVSLFAQPGPDYNLFILSFPQLLERQVHTTRHTFFLLRWSLANFL